MEAVYAAQELDIGIRMFLRGRSHRVGGEEDGIQSGTWKGPSAL